MYRLLDRQLIPDSLEVPLGPEADGGDVGVMRACAGSKVGADEVGGGVEGWSRVAVDTLE